MNPINQRPVRYDCRPRIWTLLAIFVPILIVTGCDRPDIVDAIPRSSSEKAVLVAKPTSNNQASQFRFVNSDHFLCLSIDVEPVVSSEQLADVDWAQLAKQLESVVGKANADLKNVKKICLLIDKQDVSIASMMTPRSKNFPFLFVFDFAQPVVKEEIETRNQTVIDSRKGKSRRNLPPLLLAKSLGEKRIAFGKDTLLEKLDDSSRPAPLAAKVDALLGTDEVVGVFEFGPIRDEIRAAFGMMSQIPGFEDYTTFAEVADRIDLQFSLSNEQLMGANFYIDDESLLKKIALQIQEAISTPSSNLDGMFSLGQQDELELMFKPALGEVMPDVVKQVLNDELLQVDSDAEKLTIKLTRPKQADELIKAFVQDTTHQIQLATRTASLSTIANAIKDYQKKYGRFPGQDSKDGETTTQLSWRVELLPFMDQQELYDKFKHDEAWDSDANLEVAKDIPPEFLADGGEDDSINSRFNLAIGKIGLIDDQENEEAGNDLKLIAVEGGGDVPWTKPDDFVDVDASTAGNLGQENEQGVLVINDECEVKLLSKDSPNRYLRMPSGR